MLSGICLKQEMQLSRNLVQYYMDPEVKKKNVFLQKKLVSSRERWRTEGGNKRTEKRDMSTGGPEHCSPNFRRTAAGIKNIYIYFRSSLYDVTRQTLRTPKSFILTVK